MTRAGGGVSQHRGTDGSPSGRTDYGWQDSRRRRQSAVPRRVASVSDLTELKLEIQDFADRRDWRQFHTPKNLAMAICGEAGELAAELQWLTPEESAALSRDQLRDVRLEIADVAIYLIRLSDILDIDLAEAVRQKIARFPEAM
jgi:dCTP diphosphatase